MRVCGYVRGFSCFKKPNVCYKRKRVCIQACQYSSNMIAVLRLVKNIRKGNYTFLRHTYLLFHFPF